ncbi:MAG TPA: hypothetical protein VGC54_10940 [Planctomycetota bacterium]
MSSESQAAERVRARLPLVQVIATELRDRVETLHFLAGAEDADSRRAAVEQRVRVRECLTELEGLGAEVESFRPLSLILIAPTESGGECEFAWDYGAAEVRRLENADSA